ncbi:MAG: prenyltransferase [Gammaproteobacteria bacterium]|jgi:1,4-dihydroxy-2-naphthoate octaprenyltransferase|nr:prenyltransferase [Gammaproteobacteria bacterium]NCF81443.1 prenyltransferase [Pseudomonadota bacterium]
MDALTDIKGVESNPADDAALDDKIGGILDEADRMFLATSVDGISSGASVFFARDGHDLLFFTFNPSRKAEQIGCNPTVQAVIWPKAQEGIRGLQIEGECHRIRDPDEQRLAQDKILNVTEAFRSYMDDPFLVQNRVVGYYRIRPTLTKYVDFHADPQFQWREYPQNQVGALPSMLASTLGRLRLWVRAVRAPFFTATLVPVLLGSVIAHTDLAHSGHAQMWNWAIFWLALLGGVLAQAGTNLANDYGDHTSRNDEYNKVPSPFNGGSRVIQAGLLAPWKVLLAALLCFAGTIGIGLYLNDLIAGGPFANTPLLWAGVAGCVLGVAYTLGPLRLSYRGLGEIAIAAGFGPVIVLGTHYVLSAGALSDWHWGRPLGASIPVAIFVMLIVWVNQFQDAPADAKAHKRTWVVRICEQPGPEFHYEPAFAVYRVLNGLGFATIAALGALGLAGSSFGTPYAFLAMLTMPLFFYANRLANAWLVEWNKPEADRQRLPYELLKVNALTIGIHLVTGLLIVAAYWI